MSSLHSQAACTCGIIRRKGCDKERRQKEMFQNLPAVLVCIALLATCSSAKKTEVQDTCNPTWIPLPGALSHVSASINYLWGVNSKNQIYVCHVPCTGGWKLISGGLVQTDPDDTEVWGVNSADNIWKRPVDGSGDWSLIQGKLKHVSASGNGYIWGVNRNDDIYKG